MEWMVQRKKSCTNPDSYPLRFGSDVGSSDKWGGEEIPSLMVCMKVTLSKPDRIEAHLVGVLYLIHEVLIVRGGRSCYVETDLQSNFPQ